MGKWRLFWTDKLSREIAWKLPRRVAYWAFIRVHSEATVKLSDKTHDEISWLQAAACWHAPTPTPQREGA